MRITMNKAGFMFLVIICMLMMATCGFNGCEKNTSESTPTDTLFLTQWRHEKAEKLSLIQSYELRITVLQKSKDSLQAQVKKEKKTMAALRFKAAYFEGELRQSISQSDTTCPDRDELNTLLDSLTISRTNSDTACDQTIEMLEGIVANRDSAIVFHKQIEADLWQINRQQELSTVYLNEQLNASMRREKKTTRHRKWLAAGILILSGVSTTLLTGQRLK